MDWHRDLALGWNAQSQIPIGQSTNLIGRVNLSDKGSRQVSVLKLEEESQVLRDFHVVEVEFPGQYFTDQYAGRLCVKDNGKPIDILERLNEKVGFALDEEIELFEVWLRCSVFTR